LKAGVKDSALVYTINLVQPLKAATIIIAEQGKTIAE